MPVSCCETDYDYFKSCTLWAVLTFDFLLIIPYLSLFAIQGYEGLVKTVNANGTVGGVCSGTGIQTNAEAYRTRPTSYLASGPGGLGSVLTAAVDMHNLQTYLFNL